jgi:hypothetical protein
MMHGREKSDLAIVAEKPANKDARVSAEPVEPRAGAEGNTVEADTCRTLSRASVSHGLDRVRQAAGIAAKHPRWEPDARIGHVRFCAGGGQQWPSLPRFPDLGLAASSGMTRENSPTHDREARPGTMAIPSALHAGFIR